MLVLNADTIRSLTTMPGLVSCLEEAFSARFSVPPRQVIKIPGGEGDRLVGLMPAFDLEGHGAVKLVTLFPANRAKGLPTHQAVIVVFSEYGTPIALLDGTEVTHLRTGAASALASKYLSRTDSARLVVIGTGALAPYMALGHCAVRSIACISVVGRTPERAAQTAATMRSLVSQIEVCVAKSAEDAVAAADIICCATRSPTPVLAGRWLREGAFVDLVGSFSPTTREGDDDVVLRSRIFVDTREGALSEAGDILDPLARGIITMVKIEGDLADLVTGRIVGRRSDEEIILFKSVGTAIEDLVAARWIVSGANQSSQEAGSQSK